MMPLFPGVSLANILRCSTGWWWSAAVLCSGTRKTSCRALIVILASAKVSDLIIAGLDYAKLCYIITDHPDEIAKTLLENSPRGVTKIGGEGMYTKTEKNILMTVIKKQQITQLRKIVLQIDPSAFIIVSEATEVLGEGFQKIAP